MVLLDTDHVTHLKYIQGHRATKLLQRLEDKTGDDEVGITIITVEEQMRGWLASIAKEKEVTRQVIPYQQFFQLFDFFDNYHITLFNEAAAAKFDQLRASKIRIGTLDLKIASITLVHQALLLSANLSDFRQIPGLRVENWLD